MSKHERQKRWRERNPLAAWAHVALQSAIRRGLISRQPCEECGDPQTDAHHPDYTRPAHVQWLCRKHHKEEHRRIRCEAAE